MPKQSSRHRASRRRSFVALSSAVAVAVIGAGVRADTRADLGIRRLAEEQGITLDGAGLPVAQVEANGGSGFFPGTDPNPSSGEFAGKHFTFVTSTANPAIGASVHAATVGTNYYGDSGGAAPGVTDVSVYSLEGWNEKVWHSGTVAPAAIGARVANHSYLIDQSQLGLFLAPRVDFMTERDDLIQTIAVNNNDVNPPAGSSLSLPIAMNAITVGRVNGNHVSGTDGGASPYTPGRVAPLLVAPADTTSYAAPLVAGLAADLVQAAHDNPSFSNGEYTSPRTGATIRHGETSEVIKALLLSGADREGVATYTVNSTNGLDTRFGAGRANLYNSYQELAAGEQDAKERGNKETLKRWGYDYESAFTNTSKNSYVFTGDLARKGIIASLVWNAKVPAADQSSFEESAKLYNFDLQLFDITAKGQPAKLIAQSASRTENTENLFFGGLRNKHKYVMIVKPAKGQPAFTWDYGLSWRFIPDASVRVGTTDGVYDLRWGDADGDGAVTQADVALFQKSYGKTANATWSEGDFDGNGAVDFTDFSYMAAGSQLPTSFGPAALPLGTTVPEPASLGVVVMGLAMLPVRRRRGGGGRNLADI
jgi:hypothetical protein